MQTRKAFQNQQQSWINQQKYEPQTLQRLIDIGAHFSNFAEAVGVTELDDINQTLCEAFVTAVDSTGQPTSIHVQHQRRWTLNAHLIDIQQNSPASNISIGKRPSGIVRPLTDDEIQLGRTGCIVHNRPNQRRLIAWALAESTATTSEIPNITAQHIHDGELELPGTARLKRRVVQPEGWAQKTVNHALKNKPPPDKPLTYSGTKPAGHPSPQATTCRLIYSILDDTHLSTMPGIKPASIRNWRGRNAYDHGATLIEVAELLGHPNLDRTAAAIGLKKAIH